MLIHEVKARAAVAIKGIEHRENVIRVFSTNVDVFKNCKYIDDRSLEEYYSCLPFLKQYLSKNITVLDIGCGNGRALREIRDTFSCDIIGLTLENSFKPDFPIVYSSADKLPFSDNIFDVIVSVHGISWEPNQKKAILEVVRVLKPGGTAHIYLIKFSHSIALFIGNRFWDGINRNAYEKFEFSPEIHIKDADLFIKELEFPKEKCDGYYKEWQILLKKKK